MAENRELQIVLKMKDQASKELDKFKGGLGALSGVAKVAGIALVGATAGAVAYAGKLALASAENERVAITFKNLADSMSFTQSIMQEMRNATNGLVNDTDLMKSGNKFMAMGLAETQSQMSELMGMATRLGQAMGEDATASMENFALMLANQSIPRLDSFGISSGKVRSRILELMEADMSLTREQAFMTATMEQGRATMEKLGEFTPTLSEKINQMSIQWANVKSEIGERLMPILVPFIEKLLETAEVVLPALLAMIEKVIVIHQEYGGIVKFLRERLLTLIKTIDDNTGAITILKTAWDNIVLVFTQNLLPVLYELWEVIKPLTPFLETLAKVVGVILYGAFIAVVKVLEVSLIVAFTAVGAVIQQVIMFVNAAIEIWNKFTSIIYGVISAIDALIKKLGLLNVVSNGIAAVKGAISSVTQSVTGARATGGGVAGNRSYLVGENGAEIFTPNASGMITPSGGLGGGATINVTVTGNNIGNNMDLRNVADQVGREIMNTLRDNKRIVF